MSATVIADTWAALTFSEKMDALYTIDLNIQKS